MATNDTYGDELRNEGPDAERDLNDQTRRVSNAANDVTPTAARADLPDADEHATTGDLVGEGVGGVSGALVGAGIGALGGPLGAMIGALAGVVSGWWAGKAVSEAATTYTDEDDAYYRDAYERSPNRLADRSYDDVRPAYQLGHLAAENPDYNGRRFDEIEGDLRKGWDNSESKSYGEWERVRGYANDAYERHMGRRVRAASTFTAHMPVAEGGLGSDLTNG